MSKVLFINGNAHGHINPTLPVVRELVERSEQVYYFSTAEFRQMIEETGAVFLDYGDRLTNFLKSFHPSGNHPFFTLIEFMLQMDRVVIPIILDRVGDMEIDYIIHDSMFGGGRIISEKLHLPAVCSCSSFAMEKLPLPDHMLQPGFHPQLDMVYRLLEEAAQEWSPVRTEIGDIFFQKEKLNIVYTSRLFQPGGESFDEHFCFVGPSILERTGKMDFELVTDKKIIYISMGTINDKCMDFYRMCIDAFCNRDCMVILSVGTKTDIAALGNIPDNFIVRNFVPQLEVLKKADVFISHGGLNSVSEAIYYGVPVISIPLANDQPMVTGRLVALGAGIGLKPEEVTEDVLIEAVTTILSSPDYKSSCNSIRSSFLEAGGYKAAVECIQKYIV